MSREDIYYWKCDRPSAFQPHDERDATEMEAALIPAIRAALEDEEARLEPFDTQGNHLAWTVHQPSLDRVSFLRVEDGPEGDDYLEIECSLLDRVRSPLAPTPRWFARDTSRETVPFAWQVIEYLPQPSLQYWQKRGELVEKSIAFQIGQAIAEIQRVPVSGYGPFRSDSLKHDGELRGWHGSYPDYFFLRLDDHLATLVEGGLLTLAERNRIEQALANQSALLDLSEPCLVHKDTALWNLLGTQNRITAVIDWDDAIGGDPIDDMALLGCFFDEPFLTWVFAGFESLRPRPGNFEPRFWLHVLRNLIFKAAIRLRGGFFDRDDAFFLVATGSNGSNLRSETRDRLLGALENLQRCASTTVFS